jgi:hypothetical protein
MPAGKAAASSVLANRCRHPEYGKNLRKSSNNLERLQFFLAPGIQIGVNAFYSPVEIIVNKITGFSV